jgi:hypothetical protein
MPIGSAIARTTPSSMKYCAENTRATSPPARREHASMITTAAIAIAIAHANRRCRCRATIATYRTPHNSIWRTINTPASAPTECVEDVSREVAAHTKAEEHSRDRGRGDGSGCDVHYESIASHRTKQMSVCGALETGNDTRWWCATALAKRESRLDACRKA